MKYNTTLKRYAVESHLLYEVLKVRAESCWMLTRKIKDESLLDNIIARTEIDLVSDETLWKIAHEALSPRIRNLSFEEYCHRNDYNDILKMINGDYHYDY